MITTTDTISCDRRALLKGLIKVVALAVTNKNFNVEDDGNDVHNVLNVMDELIPLEESEVKSDKC